MTDLSTTYMGLKLRNPILVASSSLTNTVENIRKCEKAGAGAIVLKSLFEEQIQAEGRNLAEGSHPSWHPEAFDYLQKTAMEMSESDYLRLVKGAREAVSIPVIASLNCISSEGWLDYAEKIQTSGADALEVNIAMMPSDPKRTAAEIEDLHYRLIERLRKQIRIPIAVKLGPFFTSMPRIAAECLYRGANALVLFNRFYLFDIDLERMKTVPGSRFSGADEYHQSLRWTALLAGRYKIDLSASTGIHDAATVLKFILAGATTVQLCSVLYRNGLDLITTILKDMTTWMESHSIEALPEIRGKLSQMQSNDPELYERLQYIKALVGIE